MAQRSLQTEILTSLSLVMLTASVMLALLLMRAHEAQLLQLRQLVARALAADARSSLALEFPAVSGLRWWSVQPDGRTRAHGGHGSPPGAEVVALGEEARSRGLPLLRAGAPWLPVLFAAPVPSRGEIALAELPPAVSGRLLLGLLAADVCVFTAFGASLLRRRVVGPLTRLAQTARALGEGALGVRASVEGGRETSELARSFNDMTEALEKRSRALEKAVADLRESNRRLREARVGLDRAERLASVGRLAAGVAHEVGNPMGALLAFLDVVARDPELSSRAREALARAEREGERVRIILRQLLDFSRPQRAERVPIDVAGICEETAALVRAQRRYAKVALDVARPEHAATALADPGAVGQILLNLLLNAADALAATEEPHIRVTVARAHSESRAGETDADAHGRRRHDAVVCRVADNGPGIPEEDRERIFDPFYTTKAPGEGTGLGLANASRLAEEMGGRLELEQAGPDGAVFSLRLPAVLDDPDAGVRSE